MNEKINQIIKNKFNVEPNPNMSMLDFCEDSISRVELLFDIEEAIGKRIPENDIFEIENLQDLYNIVGKL
jgi:acyl carrier protein